MNEEQFESLLKSALKREQRTPHDDEAAAARVLARLSNLPRQKMLLWRWPAELLNWDFAPAWPRMAALAGCAAIGFAIGIAGIDRRFDQFDEGFAVARSADLGAIVFEPETLTGARP
jgi:hypothetical protein